MRRSKIVCTIGPSSEDQKTLTEMVKNGMDVARLNMSHGDHEYHRSIFQRIREISDRSGRHVAVICDIQGPKVRVGHMDVPMAVKTGEEIIVLPEGTTCQGNCISIDPPGIISDLSEGDEIFINDGSVRITVKEARSDRLVCNVENGGIISSRKGCNIPSHNLSLRVPTEKDVRDLEFISVLDPEYVAVSFVNGPEDILSVRKVLDVNGADRVKLIAKIERPKALDDLDAIIRVSDAIMVARGDLGVEIPPDKVPPAQKEIIRRCNRAGRPVIVATQMLESMLTSPRPTRAEASDVFNAVLDGADALMLSAESSTGQYPIESLRFMDRVARTAESNLPMRDPDYYDSSEVSLFEASGHSCFILAKELREMGMGGKMIAITRSGFSARMISKYRPGLPLIAMSPELRTARELSLLWGTVPVHSPWLKGEDIESRAVHAIRWAVDAGMVGIDEHVIIVFTSIATGDSGIYTAIYDVSTVLGHTDL